MKPEESVFFESPIDFRQWLEDNHASASELWIGYHKASSGLGGMTYAQAVDEALCFGWIDGQVRHLDEASYANRWTPRRPGSTWSAANVKRVGELIEAGRMAPPGVRAFTARRAERTAQYSYENRPRDLPEEFATGFRANRVAWKFFRAAPSSYRRSMTWWIVSGKKPETRERRLRAIIKASEEGRRLDEMRLPRREKS